MQHNDCIVIPLSAHICSHLCAHLLQYINELFAWPGLFLVVEPEASSLPVLCPLLPADWCRVTVWNNFTSSVQQTLYSGNKYYHFYFCICVFWSWFRAHWNSKDLSLEELPAVPWSDCHAWIVPTTAVLVSLPGIIGSGPRWIPPVLLWVAASQFCTS